MPIDGQHEPKPPAARVRPIARPQRATSNGKEQQKRRKEHGQASISPHGLPARAARLVAACAVCIAPNPAPCESIAEPSARLMSVCPELVVNLAGLVKHEPLDKEGAAAGAKGHPAAQQSGNQTDARACPDGDPGRALAANIEHHRPGRGHRHPKQPKDGPSAEAHADRIPAGTASISAARKAGFQSTVLASCTASFQCSGWVCPGTGRPCRPVAADRKRSSSGYSASMVWWQRVQVISILLRAYSIWLGMGHPVLRSKMTGTRGYSRITNGNSADRASRSQWLRRPARFLRESYWWNQAGQRPAPALSGESARLRSRSSRARRSRITSSAAGRRASCGQPGN